MYGFVGSYSRLRFCVITSSFVRYVPINNKRLLVGAGLGLHNWEVSGALWASSFTEEPTVVANSTGAVCSGAQTAGQWARFQIAKMAYGQVMVAFLEQSMCSSTPTTHAHSPVHLCQSMHSKSTRKRKMYPTRRGSKRFIGFIHF